MSATRTVCHQDQTNRWPVTGSACPDGGHVGHAARVPGRPNPKTHNFLSGTRAAYPTLEHPNDE